MSTSYVSKGGRERLEDMEVMLDYHRPDNDIPEDRYLKTSQNAIASPYESQMAPGDPRHVRTKAARFPEI